MGLNVLNLVSPCMGLNVLNLVSPWLRSAGARSIPHRCVATTNRAPITAHASGPPSRRAGYYAGACHRTLARPATQRAKHEATARHFAPPGRPKLWPWSSELHTQRRAPPFIGWPVLCLMRIPPVSSSVPPVVSWHTPTYYRPRSPVRVVIQITCGCTLHSDALVWHGGIAYA